MRERVSDHPYGSLLSTVLKPGRYVGLERGSVGPAAPGDVRVALAFPEVYELAMSYLGFKILYEHLNRAPHLHAERVFCPWPDMEAALRREGIPLVTLDTATPVGSLDVVGFSLQYELTYTNLLTMLDLAHIPLMAEDRGEEHPLVIGGGPCATHPEPVAPFFDAFLPGDGEVAFAEALEAYRVARDAGKPRRERLAAMAATGHLYVPSSYGVTTAADGVVTPALSQPVPLARLDDLDRAPYPARGPEALIEPVFDRLSVEIARGCGQGCRFCQAGFVYRPYRERSPASLLETVLEGMLSSGDDTLSLTSLSTADYSALGDLAGRLSGLLDGTGTTTSVSSLRAYGLGDDLLDVLSLSLGGSVTLAPEAGSQRLRDVINKNVSAEDLRGAVATLYRRGFTKLKLYFMVGLPTETEEDVRAIAELVMSLKELSWMAKKRPRISVSVSTFVPRPHTPFQWDGVATAEEIDQRQRLLRRLFKGSGVSLSTHDIGQSILEARLARGDRRLAEVILAAWRSGCRFDGWSEEHDPGVWDGALEDAGLGGRAFLDEVAMDATLPWDHIDTGVERGFLARERRRAQEARTSPPCGRFVVGPHRATRGEASCVVCGHDCADVADPLDDELAAEVVARYAPRFEALVAMRREEPVRHRLVLTKAFPASLLGHLDFVRLLVRALGRAGLGVVMSGGYSARPKVAGGRALPLGVESLGEPVDVWLHGAMTDEAATRLAAELSPGVELLSWRLAEQGERKPDRAYDGAIWEVTPRGDGAPPREAVAGALETVLASTTLEIKGKDRRDRLVGAVIEEGDPWVLRLTVRYSDHGDLRVDALLEGHLGFLPGTYHIVRTHLLETIPAE